MLLAAGVLAQKIAMGASGLGVTGLVDEAFAARTNLSLTEVAGGRDPVTDWTLTQRRLGL
jgi:hypothetical protein